MDLATLQTALRYNPKTGVFTDRRYRDERNIWRGQEGRVAGCLEASGYIRIRIKGKMYAAHRLAWLYMTGRWPSLWVDHINRIRHDNRWNNLRLATASQSRANATHEKSISGKRGVTQQENGRWRAVLRANGKNVWLGAYNTIDAAYEAYIQAAKREWGEFFTP